MFAKAKYIGLGLLVLVLGLWIRGCLKDRQLPVSFNAPLPKNTAAQVVVTDRHIAVRTNNRAEATYVPDGGSATVTINKDNSFRLNVKDHGLTFRPVVGGMVSSKLRLSLGAQIGYWNRFEIYAGGAVAPKPLSPVAFVALGYRLDQLHLRNTSIAIGYNTANEVSGLVLVRF